jgi:hypothetical protein
VLHRSPDQSVFIIAYTRFSQLPSEAELCPSFPWLYARFISLQSNPLGCIFSVFSANSRPRIAYVCCPSKDGSTQRCLHSFPHEFGYVLLRPRNVGSIGIARLSSVVKNVHFLLHLAVILLSSSLFTKLINATLCPFSD